MKKRVVGFLVLLATIIGFNSYAQKPALVTSNEKGWSKIGETTASFKSQAESIAVLGADEFTALKLKISDADLAIDRMQVFYESGDMEDIDVKGNLKEGSESQVFKLQHPDRDIQKVAFTYHTSANSDGEKAHIELYGLKTNQPAGSDAYRNDADKAIENTGDDIENAADEVGEETREAGHEINREANETGNEIDREVDDVDVDAEAEDAANDVEDAARKTGNAISEGVNDAAAAIKDEKLDDKVGPGGETAYMDDEGKFYYINNEGKKVYINALQLQEKKDNR